MADTMREKLIELQKESVKNCVPGETCVNCRYIAQTDCMERLTADYMVANGVTVQQWIPASEPPEDLGEYIVMIKGAKRSTTLWYHPMRETWEECGGLAPYPVTHWMPLPTPPEGGDNHE